MRPGQRAQIAVSSLGGFRTPAARACGIVRRGRHPKTFTHKETYAVQQKLLMVFQPRLSLECAPGAEQVEVSDLTG